ncbi:MAG TPA: uracil-DNA glycosylase [Limnochordales bacterium]
MKEAAGLPPCGSGAGQEFNPDAAWRALEQRIVDCQACPRLVQYRQQVAARGKREFAGWQYWGRPVPGFGDPRARVLVVGLAPAAHGANRTGRMFTGDASADFLVAALFRAGFANQPYSRRADDGLVLREVFLTAPVRCAPPDNRPLPEERDRCLPFLEEEFRLLRPHLRVVVALGRFALDCCRRLLQGELSLQERRRLRQFPFRHGAVLELADRGLYLVASYHPSRQNTQTGRLTAAMMDQVFQTVRRLLEPAGPVAPFTGARGAAGGPSSAPGG